jgi:hypothetical protein
MAIPILDVTKLRSDAPADRLAVARELNRTSGEAGRMGA